MGIAMAPVNQVTAEGLPVLFIKDLPPVSTVSVKVTRPQIYYGELTNSYVFVGTGQKEFDYPAGEKNVYTNYTGRGGVPVGSFLRRALYAWQFGSTDILLSSYLSHDARILYRRNIVERAQDRPAVPGFRRRAVSRGDRFRHAEMDARRVHVEPRTGRTRSRRRTARTTCATASRS